MAIKQVIKKFQSALAKKDKDMPVSTLASKLKITTLPTLVLGKTNPSFNVMKTMKKFADKHKIELEYSEFFN